MRYRLLPVQSLERPESDQVEIPQYLLEKGADIDAFEYAYHEKGFRYHAALEARHIEKRNKEE